MSINNAHALEGGVLIFNGELILIYYDGVDLKLEPGSDVPAFKGTKKGRMYLTSHRIIFTNKISKDLLQSFSVPFHCMKGLELEQPVFGANYIKGKFRAEPSGGWSGEANFKMWFTHGGAIEFGQALLEAGRLASRYGPAPPSYQSVVAGSYYMCAPDAYLAPRNASYGWVPYQTFPDVPPTNSVYMAQAPPPYPGVQSSAPQPDYYQQQQAPPTQNGTISPAEAKAQEAMMEGTGPAGAGYYNPQNPHTVYAPPPPQPPPHLQSQPPPVMPSAPPSYEAAIKKND